MWSTPSLQLLPGPLWPRLIVPVRVPSMNQIESLTKDSYHFLFETIQQYANHLY